MSINIANDFIIINYNENNKSFTSDDLSKIITEIKDKKYSIIVVCTQQSASFSSSFRFSATHFQHILKESLKKLENITYKMLVKSDNNNIRTRVYYNETDVYKNTVMSINSKENYKDKENESYKNNSNYINSPTIYQIYQIYKYGFYNHNNYTLIRVVLRDKNNKVFKFIVVNTDLTRFNDHSDQSKYIIFKDIIQNSKMSTLFFNNYKIFFCGDFNFNFFRKTYQGDHFLQNKKNNKDILYYGNNTLMRNELYEYFNVLKNEIKTANISNLIKEFKKNMKEIGLHISCHLNNPSMCSKILFADNEELDKKLTIKNNNFKIVELTKSKKTMILYLECKMIFV